MAGRGILFAITGNETERLYKLAGSERPDFILHEIEDNYFEGNPERTCELGTAWNAIHRSLTDGFLHWENGDYPLSHVILGGEVLYGSQEGEEDFIIVLKSSGEVKKIAKALADFTEDDLKKGYAQINIDDYDYHLGFDDLEYTLGFFDKLKTFWQKAANDNLSIIFTCAM